MTELSSINKFDQNWSCEWKGLWDYRQALWAQEERAHRISTGEALPVIWGLEHPRVVTLGRRSHLDPKPPCEQGPFVTVERGGEATLHIPGQLVIYPLLPVDSFGGVRGFVDHLLTVTQKTLLEFGISTEKTDTAGLWTKSGKICFLGIRIHNRVSTHGLSINLSNDLSEFRNMKACGVLNPQIDRVLDHGVSVSSLDFFDRWCSYF